MKKKPKFKAGDTITAIQQNNGLAEATILRVEKDHYYCKIINGWSTVPFSSEYRYRLKTTKK